MKMVRVEFDSPIDEFAHLIRRLAEFEARFGMSSETFFERFQSGQCDDPTALRRGEDRVGPSRREQGVV
jgi:hypothetical protein